MNKYPQPIINKSQCTLCGACINGCSEGALVMETDGPAFREPVSCTYCTDCEDLCPTGAIRAPLTIRWSSGV